MNVCRERSRYCSLGTNHKNWAARSLENVKKLMYTVDMQDFNDSMLETGVYKDSTEPVTLANQSAAADDVVSNYGAVPDNAREDPFGKMDSSTKNVSETQPASTNERG
ncbi:hypothetical protein ColLi_12156 [Colletotrichum liriopes]|uniref:Uncharacterized protein n=1 Tax=Colletotrichum liriopes TaxID=708192 RepID=A0AA37H0F7_9PEZI|nr:hypothetical protein ColLi_12156 [Colletotrichum liriopes]